MTKLGRYVSNPPGIHAPVGMYSHLAHIKAREFLFLAGQVALNEKGNTVGKGDSGVQTRQVYKNIGKILESAGASYNNIVQVTTYLVGRSSVQPYLDTRSEVLREIYPDGNYPPNTLLIVNGLLSEDMLVEIAVVAALH